MEPTARAPLGKTKLHVTRLGLGGAPIGGLSEEGADETARDIVRRAYELGIRTFDTAPLYGRGASERRVGPALAAFPRDSFVLSTKVGRLIREDAQGTPQAVFDFSYDGVLRSFEESLRRLGLDRVDVLLIHDPDNHFQEALSGAYRALDDLRRQGVIGALGAGMNQAEMPARFAREADFDCFLLAGRYTLLDQRGLAELLPRCVEKRIGIIIGGVYNSGILANPAPGATFNYRPAAAPWLDRAQRLQAVCARHNTPLMAAAIQFPLAHPAVATVLTGVQSVAELEQNERMMRYPIPPALWHDLKAEGLLPEDAPTPRSE